MNLLFDFDADGNVPARNDAMEWANMLAFQLGNHLDVKHAVAVSHMQTHGDVLISQFNQNRRMEDGQLAVKLTISSGPYAKAGSIANALQADLKKSGKIPGVQAFDKASVVEMKIDGCNDDISSTFNSSKMPSSAMIASPFVALVVAFFSLL